MNRNHARAILAIVAFVIIFIVPSQCFAGSATLILRRVKLQNVNDAAGSWQFEGGNVFKGTKLVGHYAVTRRVVTAGTTPQNTSMVTVTVFFIGSKPPQNITVQGSHDYSSGRFIGSVSASSGRYSWIRNASVAGHFSAASSALNFTWLDAGTLTLP